MHHSRYRPSTVAPLRAKLRLCFQPMEMNRAPIAGPPARPPTARRDRPIGGSRGDREALGTAGLRWAGARSSRVVRAPRSVPPLDRGGRSSNCPVRETARGSNQCTGHAPASPPPQVQEGFGVFRSFSTDAGARPGHPHRSRDGAHAHVAGLGPGSAGPPAEQEGETIPTTIKAVSDASDTAFDLRLRKVGTTGSRSTQHARCLSEHLQDLLARCGPRSEHPGAGVPGGKRVHLRRVARLVGRPSGLGFPPHGDDDLQ